MRNPPGSAHQPEGLAQWSRHRGSEGLRGRQRSLGQAQGFRGSRGGHWQAQAFRGKEALLEPGVLPKEHTCGWNPLFLFSLLL